ncbi:MAG: hypothetical protein PHF29_10080, partial [Candidatus Riflebacteria bacterium]|nr:hypothetical protein [Candidatus Riflebacteria bacterium]
NHQCIQAARAGTKRIRPLVAKNLFTSTTHPTVASITEAFWQNRSPMMIPKSYNTQNENNKPTIEGWGTNSTSITVSATYDLEIITPFISSIIGRQNKTGKITLSATATEKKE